MIALWLALSAEAADTPSLWARQMVGGGGWPSGLITDTRAQVRAPLYRSDSIVFQETFAGAGARIAASPAFFEVGPRLSIAPIDVFDVDVQASWHQYFDNDYGVRPMKGLTGTKEEDREASEYDAFGTTALSLTVAPTLKAKVGPIVAFDSWTIQGFALNDPPELEHGLVYHPFWDLVIEPTDVILEHQAAALVTVLPGDDGPLLWVGPTFRDRWAQRSHDHSMVLGAFVRARPGREDQRAIPNVMLMVLPYLVDADLAGGPPNVQLAAIWSVDRPLR
jgi:hypothetical protein